MVKTKDDKRARFTLRLPEKLLTGVGNEAVADGVSVNSFIVKILRDWVEQGETSDKGPGEKTGTR